MGNRLPMVMYMLRLPERVHRKSIEVAESQDRTVAAFYRRVITRYIQRLDKEGTENGKRKQGE